MQRFSQASPARSIALAFSASWRERDSLLWYHAHQMYRCDSDDLTEPGLQEVQPWCCCLSLISLCQAKGVEHLTDDECVFVVDALDDFVPNLAEHVGYLPIYEACRRRAEPGGA